MPSSEREGWLVRHPRDRINVLSALAAPVVFFYPFYHGVETALELTVYVILLLIWIVDINYVLHLHVHRPFTTSTIINRLIDFSLASVTGMTSANWRIQHVYGHHRGHDAAYTARRFDWTMRRYSMKGALAFAFGNSWPTFSQPIAECWRKGFRRHVKTPIDYRRALIEQFGFLTFVGALAIWRPLLTFAFLLPWYAMIFAMTRYVDYLNHYGCSQKSMDFANNSICRSFNWRINNFGYHTAHHIDPCAHWTELPKIHARVADKIPPERIKTFDWSSALLPYHAWCEAQDRRR